MKCFLRIVITMVLATLSSHYALAYHNISPYAWCGGNPVKFIDPDGKEKLIYFSPDANMDIAQKDWAKNYQDDNAIHVFAHGTTDNNMMLYVNNKRIYIKSADQFKNIILSNSTIWKKRKSGDNITIILHSCSTGKGLDSFAKNLSEDIELTGVKIVAPSENIGIKKDHKSTTVRTQKIDSHGKPISIKKGEYRVFVNGKVVARYDSDWNPKYKPSKWENFLYEKWF